MRNIVTLIASVLILAACSSPKYTYYFDRYDYNSGKKPKTDQVVVAAASADNGTIPALQIPAPEIEESPLLLNPEGAATMSADNAPNAAPAPVIVNENLNPGKKYSEMSRTERKEFKKALKSEIRNLAKGQKGPEGGSVSAAKAMDNDLKMAIIFGAVALTLSFFGGVNSVFWILSVVSVVIAVVFFIKWLAEQ